MPYNPFAWWAAFRFIRWLLWRGPRGIYHLVDPAAFDRWRVKEALREAWGPHKRACHQCSREHRAHVLATVEDALIESGEVRSRLTRMPDDVTWEPRRESLPGR